MEDGPGLVTTLRRALRRIVELAAGALSPGSLPCSTDRSESG